MKNWFVIGLMFVTGGLGMTAVANPAAAAPVKHATKRHVVAKRAPVRRTAHKRINCALCAADPAMQWQSPNVRLGGLSCDFKFNVRWWHLNGKYSHSEYLAILDATAGNFIRDVPLPKGWVGTNNWLDKWGNPYTYPKGGGLYYRDHDPRKPTVDLIYTAARPHKPYMFRSDGDKSCNNLMEGPPPPVERRSPPAAAKREWEIDIVKRDVVCDDPRCTEDHFAGQLFSFYRYRDGQTVGNPLICNSKERRIKLFVDSVGSYTYKEVLTQAQRDQGYDYLTDKKSDGVMSVYIDQDSPKVTELVVDNSYHHPKKPTWEIEIEKEAVKCDRRDCKTDHFGSEEFSFYEWENGHTVGQSYRCNKENPRFTVRVTEPGTYTYKEVLSREQIAAGYGYLSCRKTDGVVTVTITANSPSVVTVKVTNIFRHPREVLRQQPSRPMSVPLAIPLLEAPIPPLPYNGGNGYIRQYETRGPQIGVALVRCATCGKPRGSCHHPPPPGGGGGHDHPPVPPGGGKPPGDPADGMTPTGNRPPR